MEHPLASVTLCSWEKGTIMSDPQAFFDIPDVSKLNMDELVTELPGSPWWKTVFGGNQGKYVSAFLKSETILKDHGINTALRLAHFLGQGLIHHNTS